MDKTEFVALISSRSPKLKAYREQAANGNEQKKRLYMAALTYLLEQRRTQASAYEQITQLLVTASAYIVKQIDNQLIPTILRHHHSSLDDYIILWQRMFDGSTQRKKYPNFQTRLKSLKVKNHLKELDSRMKNYLLEFEKNYNQKNDERVEFFQDFQDSVMSDSVLNESQLMNVVYLSIMEVKAARKKLTEEKLTDEALDEQLIKLKHFLSLNIPNYLSESESQQFKKEREWARQYLENKQEFHRRNPNISVNQTFVIEGEQEKIQVIKDNPKPRMFKHGLERQFFEDEVNMEASKPRESKENNFVKAIKGMGNSPTPIKMIDPRFVDHDLDSHDASLVIHDGLKPLAFGNYRQQLQNKQDIAEEDLIIRKIKPQDVKPISRGKPVQLQDFSITQNYFNKPQIMSPRIKNQSQTLQAWGSPTKYGKFKLSQFTSEKKVRKETAPKNQLSTAEPHVIQPYLQYFEVLSDYARFRRHCFEGNYTMISSTLLTVNCLIEKDVNSKVKLELVFTNNYYQPLDVSIVYKVPQCFTIEKRTKIAKRFQLQSNIVHAFCLGAEEFPLEPCLISLKAKSADHQHITQTQIPFSLTILNFIEYECATEEAWVREWNALNSYQGQLFFLAKHIEVDRHVTGDEIDFLLKDLYVRLAAVSGYSVQDYGCICFYPSLNGLRFLLHLSVRVDNIVSLQIITARSVSKDERQFVEYCMNIWMMLLGKLYL